MDHVYTDKLFFYVSSANSVLDWINYLNGNLTPSLTLTLKLLEPAEVSFQSECPGASCQLWTIKPGSNWTLTTLGLGLGFGLGFPIHVSSI